MDPTVFYIAGGLLALVIGHEIFSDDDDDDNDSDSSSGNQDNDDDDRITVDGQISERIDLGAGNDTLDGGDVRLSDAYIQDRLDGEAYELPPDVFGGEGDDSISIDSVLGVSTHGGSGDDKILIGDLDSRISPNDDEVFVSVYGGTGNDTIVIGDAHGSSDAQGGAGDDVIVLDASDIDHDAIWLGGGLGNDTLQAIAVSTTSDPLIFEHPGGDDPSMYAGSDTYEISLSVTDADSSPDELGNFADAVAIYNFDPAEDVLVVDPTTYANGATFEGFEVMNGSHVVFHYSHPDHPGGLSMSIYAGGNGITAADVQIVDSLPDRSAA